MTLDKTALSQEVLGGNQDARVPLYGTVELTFRCNLACAHCYSLDGLAEQELTLAQYDRIFGEMAEAGCLWLQLTGGEVMLRKDFEEIYLAAKRRGFIVTVFTNATFIRERTLALFREYPPYRVEVTFHSLREATFDAVTGVRGSYRRCMANIDKLIAAGISVVLKAVGMTINADDLPATKEWCDARGIPFKFDTTLIPTLGGSLAPYSYQLAPDAVRALDALDEERFKAKAEAGLVKLRRRGPRRYDACGAGQRSFNIAPDGKLTVCALARHKSYDLRNGSFKEGWESFLPSVTEEASLPADQTWLGAKKGCPAVAMTESTSLSR